MIRGSAPSAYPAWCRDRADRGSTGSRLLSFLFDMWLPYANHDQQTDNRQHAGGTANTDRMPSVPAMVLPAI